MANEPYVSSESSYKLSDEERRVEREERPPGHREGTPSAAIAPHHDENPVFRTGTVIGVDPSANVKDLIEASVKRLDDLREAESHHVAEMARVRDSHSRDLRMAEAARIDAIRAVDVGAVNRAAEVSALQATTLANQVAVSAETLRGQVSAAATAASVALTAALDPIQTSIADLRKAQYEAQGQKTQIVETRVERGDQRNNVSIGVAMAAVLVTFLIGSMGIIVTLILSGR